jgi:phosphatidylglycerophosphate synthase
VTRRACLVGPPPGVDDVSFDVVGGLPSILRQVLSLQDAGIRSVNLVGVSVDMVRSDPRVRLDVSELRSPREVGSSILVARAGCIWHPNVVRRLARQAVAPDRSVAVGSAAAAVYLCGDAVAADVIQALARSDAVPDVLWMADADFVVIAGTDDERRRATTLLLRSLEKQADGLVSRHLHRRLSRLVTKRVLSTAVTPNQMTIVAAAVGAAGAVVALEGGYWNLVVGAMLFEAQNVLDGCDGEIARLKYLRSKAGEWLDQVMDDVLNIAFLVAVGIGLSKTHPWAWPAAGIALAAQLIHVAGLYAGLIVKAGGRGSVASLRWWIGGGTETETRQRLLGDVTRRDFYSLLYVVTALAGVPVVAFLWHAMITVASAVVSTVQWIAWNGPEYQADADGVTDPAGEEAA